MKTFFKYWLPVIFWAGLIYFASSVSGEDIPGIFYGQDISFHATVFVILAVFLNRALKNTHFCSLSKQKRLVVTILFCLVYALTDEFHQQFVFGRDCALVDVIIDGVGAIFGSIIYENFTKSRGSK